MKSLYAISSDIRLLIEDIQSQDGDIQPEQFDALKIAKGDLQQKSINYALAIKEVDSYSSIIDAEIKRLQGLKKRNEAISDRLRDKISEAMQEFGIERVETPTLILSFRPSEEVIIDNINDLPSDLVVQKTTITPDKAAIKKAIKAGQLVSGAHIQNNENLQIK